MNTPKSRLVLLVLLLGGCASTRLTPFEDQTNVALQQDERRLWRRSEEEQKSIDGSDQIYHDVRLDEYLQGVVKKLVPDELDGGALQFRVRVIKSPLLNAFTYPNGVIYVYSGILARMDNEAELATLLGHEMTHAMHRHAIEEFRHVEKSSAFLASFQAALMPLGILGVAPSLLGSVGAMASVSGYSRDREREADKNGLILMARAGYDPQQAPVLFEHLQQEVDEQKQKQPFFFGSHPRLQERIRSYKELLRGAYADKHGMIGKESFETVTLGLLIENAKLDLAAARYRSAQEGLEKALRIEPDDVDGRYYLGEMYRKRNGKGDPDEAEKAYRSVIERRPSYPDSHRGLGLIYFKSSRAAEAKVEFEKYLAERPDAQDKGYVVEYLKEIDAKMGTRPR